MTKIKTVLTYLTTHDTADGGYLSQKEERDEQGNVCLLIQYNESEEVELKNESTFDSDSRLLHYKQYTQSEQPDQHIEYEYSAAGKLAKEIIHYRDGSVSIKSYDRDEAENSYVATMVDEDGDLESKEYRRFDGEGRVLEEKVFDGDELETHRQTSFDDAGRPITLIHYNGREDLEWEFTYTYEFDEEGRLVKATVVDDEDRTIREEFVDYDEKGNRASLNVQDHEQGIALLERWEYNEADQVTSHQRLSPTGDLLSEIRYTYREDGLLVEEENRTPRGMSLRTYEYELFS
ncbi:MAG: hypothetical protein AAFV95_08915 [Bacteroidota bacterium]